MTVVEEASRREKKQETKVYEDLEPAKTVPEQKPVSDFDELSFDGFDFDELEQK